MKNKVMNYPWGDSSSIPDMMGLDNKENIPFAELWMGAHPKGSSELLIDDQLKSLYNLIENDPKPFGLKEGEIFPYLFKLLAAETPLSIQLHPDKRSAEDGFKKEEAEGPALSDPRRNFKDSNHKPEIIVALTPFSGLCGFRPLETIKEDLNTLRKSCPENEAIKTLLQANNYTELLDNLYALPRTEKVFKEVALVAETIDRDQFQWFFKIHQFYPDDPGVFFALLLNVFHLEPFQAVFIPAGFLHAYLKGFGAELMANSDNVIRGGLTGKHIDISLLKKLMIKEPMAPDFIVPEKVEENIMKYPVPVKDFALEVYWGPVNKKEAVSASGQVILCVEGSVKVLQDEITVQLEAGESCFISPGKPYSLNISGKAIKAFKA